MAEHGRERRGPDRNDTPPKRKGARRLVIRGEEWTWRYGNIVDIRDAKGNRHPIALNDLMDCNWDDIERRAWKRNLKVEPSAIVDHINRAILGYDDATGFPKGSPWHGHQAAVRPGWIAFEGPRGTWQAKLSAWICDVRSPEDVLSAARLNEILGITTNQWCDIKVKDLAAEGLTVDDLWRLEQQKPVESRTDRIRVLMEYSGPSMPVPTKEQLCTYAMRHVVGRSAHALARAAA